MYSNEQIINIINESISDQSVFIKLIKEEDKLKINERYFHHRFSNFIVQNGGSMIFNKNYDVNFEIYPERGNFAMVSGKQV